MNINKDLKKIALLMVVLSLGCGLIGATLGIFAYSQYYIPPITPQWLSRLTRLIVDGSADVPTLIAQSYQTQTSMVLTVEDYAGTDKFTVDNEGNVSASGTLSVTGGLTSTGNLTVTGRLLVDTERDSDLSGYEYFQTIQGDISGTEGGAKTYGLYINMTRPAGKENNGGDIDDAGLKIRVDTEAVTKTAGITLRALDAEAKADNPSGTTTNLVGGQITAKSDTGAGSVTNMTGLFVHAQNNAEVSTLLVPLDVRLFRQAAAEPTGEYVMRVRNSSSTGGGCDAGIYFSSDGSGETDDFDYVIDMSGADVDDADIRLSNSETIRNTPDGTIALNITGNDEWKFTADELDCTNGQLVNIGDAGTDFGSDGSLTTAQVITVAAGGVDVTGDSAFNDDVDMGAKVTSGSFGTPLDVGAARQYGYEIHYYGDNQNVTGIRSRARLKTTDASTRSAQGALLQAANADGIDAGVLNGALIEAIGKSSSSAATIGTMRGLLVNTEWDANDTVTNLKTAHIMSHTRNNAGAGSFGTGYLLYLENEAVGGNGQQFDAGIYFEGTNLSGGNNAFDYCIDMSGVAGEVGTADIRLSHGETIKNTTDGKLEVTIDGSVEQSLTASELDLNDTHVNQDLNTENIGVLPTILSINVITTTDGAVATVGAGEVWIVHAVYFETTTNFDCTGDDCTLIVGDGNNDDGFLVLADAEMQTTIQEIAGGATGWTGMGSGTVGSYLSAIAKIGFVYDGAETIDIKIEDNSDNSDPTAGVGILYIFYTRIQ